MFDEYDLPARKYEMCWNQHRNWADLAYLRLCEDILENGYLQPTRAKIDGKNVSALTVFGRQLRFPLYEGFPLLTTKRISFNNIVHELLWLLGKTDNIKYLKDNNVNIWSAWADEDGNIGQGSYPIMWRSFPYLYFVRSERPHNTIGCVDQIQELIEDINQLKIDPTASCGRRLLVSAWHPFYSKRRCQLPACHVLFQFHVHGDKLSCQLYQRSADVMIGSCYNIASYALLTHIIAYLTGLTPHEFVYTMGDVHIYENLIDMAKEQLTRKPYPMPRLEIRPGVSSIDDFVRSDFTLHDYKYHPTIKGQVAV